MTEEQKHAQAELEKTLDTLSEDELDALAGGKVTDDVKKFFQSDKGQKVLKYTEIAAGATTAAAAVAVTSVLIYRRQLKPWRKTPDEGARSKIIGEELSDFASVGNSDNDDV